MLLTDPEVSLFAQELQHGTAKIRSVFYRMASAAFRAQNHEMKADASISFPRRIVSLWPYVLIAISVIGLAYSFWVNSR